MMKLTFKVRYEIGKVLLKGSPRHRKEIVEWVLNQGDKTQ